MTDRPHLARRLLTLACAAYWVTAFAATHVPGRSLTGMHVSDKLLHLLGYFVLAGLFSLVLVARGMARRRRIVWATAVIPLYAGFDELTQMLVAGRAADWRDFAADVVGAATAIVLVELGTRVLGRRKS